MLHIFTSFSLISKFDFLLSLKELIHIYALKLTFIIFTISLLRKLSKYFDRQHRSSTKRTIIYLALCTELFKVHLMWSKITRLIFLWVDLILHSYFIIFLFIFAKNHSYFSHENMKFFLSTSSDPACRVDRKSINIYATPSSRTHPYQTDYL